MKQTAIYIHIPFCDHKCIYCDFYSIISYENVSEYLKTLKREIMYSAGKYNYGREIISIFFGGGTPSFMTPEYISEILICIKNNFHVQKNAEITLETNPGTVDKKKLTEFLKAGINRISIGIQSFHNDELEFLTRIHNSDTAINTVNTAAESGFENISIDLIFNLPNQSKEKWISNLETAVKLPVQHISAYSLILERGTILNKMVLDGKVKMQDIDHDAELYETTIEYLTQNGFQQYEVSNFAKQGYQSVHNNAYWHYKDYLSFGTSAHSFINGRRWWNYSSLKFYIEHINQKGNAVRGYENLSIAEQHDEYVMLAMRSSGIDKKMYIKKFGEQWLNDNNTTLQQLYKDNYLAIDDNFIKFTPSGYALCDEILRKLL